MRGDVSSRSLRRGGRRTPVAPGRS